MTFCEKLVSAVLSAVLAGAITIPVGFLYMPEGFGEGAVVGAIISIPINVLRVR